MTTQAYRGYLIVGPDPFQGSWVIRKDSYHIGVATSIDDAKTTIRLLTDDLDPPPRHDAVYFDALARMDG